MTAKQLLEQAIEVVVAELKKLAQPCTSSQEIAHVAAISANNDRSIGELIARAMDKVGWIEPLPSRTVLRSLKHIVRSTRSNLHPSPSLVEPAAAPV